ncbi:hypothetical protein CPB83DRAFT_74807 [Crepidotus variabilis]|uniref:Uncharacterized protein n=1 Tax=Crepidotus variabilis TaxID=179855 RepID=A0A9P6JJ89_9AGAR|nr:hypothetical protein CPB83DRAFT_74807 [Crepidotus variabilis]
MSTLSRLDTITRAIAAAREEAATVPLKEYDADEETIRGVPRESRTLIDTSIFDALTDFELDLSLSPASSPTSSTSEMLPSTPTPPLSPSLSRTFSFSSRRDSPPTLTWKKPASSTIVAKSSIGTRGSWPLVGYTGRGTPIDQRRRLEWAGVPNDAVGEDGYLFSDAVRSTSLDSAVQRSELGTSSEWDHITASISHSTSGASSIHEPPPELGPLSIERNSADHSDEWAGIMVSVLASSSQRVLSPKTPSFALANPSLRPVEELATEETTPVMPPIDFTIMSKEQVDALNSGLETELGLNAPLDLGLGQNSGADIDWAKSKQNPSLRTHSRCSSRSVYSDSQIITQRAQSIAGSNRSERRSTTSNTAEEIQTNSGVDKSWRPWWRRLFSRFRSSHVRVTFQKDRF